MNLLPSAHGLLGAKRFPAGTLVVWSGEKYPSADDRDASDVTRVLGIENWFLWWEGDNRRLYPGVPVTDDRRDRGGHSVIVVQPTTEADQKEFGSPEAALRYSLENELHDWLPPLLLNEAAGTLGDEAGRIRERLARRANSRFLWLWPFGLGGLVGNLSDVQYRLERIRQAVKMDGDRGPFQQFPMMVLRERFERSKPQIRRTSAARLALWLREAMADPKAPTQPHNLRQAVLDSLDRLTQESLEDVRLSFERAHLLSEIRSTNVLLGLTMVLALLTLILVVHNSH
jgi:hypothetical protein